MNYTEDDKLLLAAVFGAYFHEDWHCDALNTESVIHSFLKTATPGEIMRLHDAVIRYAGQELDNSELEMRLLSELGCYYRPSSGGVSVREWMLGIAAMLRAAVVEGQNP